MTGTKDRIYELIRVPREKENLYRIRMFREVNFIRSKNGQAFKDVIRRIAVVDTEAAALTIPYCGFTNICINDPTVPKGFRVIEKRKEDIWKDCEETNGKI